MEITYQVVKDDYVNAGKVSSQIKKLLKELKIDANILRKIAVASYEAEINMIIHAYGGRITMIINSDNILIEFVDEGPGITDIKQAMVKGYSTANAKARAMGFGAGMGLYNMQRLASVFSITSKKSGTIIKMRFDLS